MSEENTNEELEVEQGVDPEVFFEVDDEFKYDGLKETPDEESGDDSEITEDEENSDEEDSDEFDSDDEEEEEDSDEEDSDSDEEKGEELPQVSKSTKEVNKPASEDSNKPLTSDERLIEEISNCLEMSDVPNTVEYRKSAIAEAKKKACQELGISEDDYNSFDEEHQFAFAEKLEQVRAEKKAKFNSVVERIEKKHAEEARISMIENLINSQCDTKEKKARLEKAILGASTGYTEGMKQELLQGKTDRLQKLINLAVGGNTAVNKSAHSHNNKPKKTKSRKDNGYASDLVFGF